MNIDGTSAASQTASSSVLTNSQEDKASISGDFETFLTLMTAQMRNQDPLKPMDSTEFVSQLANFSAVEQQVKTNDALDAIFNALNADLNLSGLATWIGREAQHSGASLFDGEPMEVATTPNAAAQSGVMEVINESGNVVRRQQFPPDANTVTWDGTLDDLSFAPLGEYAFRMTYSSGDEPLDSQTGHVFLPINEVKIENGAAILVGENGMHVPLSAVTGVRAPEEE